MVRINLLIIVLLVFSFGCSATSRPCGVSPDLLESVVANRGLSLDRAIPCIAVGSTTRDRFIQDSLNQVETRQRLDWEGRTLKALGIIPRSENYYSLLNSAYSSRISGYYDRKRKELIVSSEATERDIEAIQRHELVHALQDQHFDLNELLNDQLTSDAKLARHALLEGDANLVSFLLSSANPCSRFTKQTIPLLLELRKNSISLEDSVALRLLMDFPYLYGVTFACAITAGHDFAPLNALLTHPPTTTKQLFEHSSAQSAVSRQSLLPEQCQFLTVSMTEHRFRDSLGFFFVVSLLAEEFPISAAFRLVEGYHCDVLELTRESEKRFDWQIYWADENAALDFANAYREWWSNRLHARRANRSQVATIEVDGAITRISVPIS